MVVALGPGKFYGSSLPRPRFYTNPDHERVDPPVSVLDPFLSWAEEAHWSMGGLSFKRLRLQGRIEGNINKLRSEREKIEKKAAKGKGFSPSPPPEKVNLKRKIRLVDEFEDDVEVVGRVEKRGLVRKLDDDFDRVATRNREDVVEEVNKVKTKGKSRRLVKGLKSNGSVTPTATRVSPRLSKRGLP
ncbi:uncharacterized protein LOC132054794 [Lycium ferocissimum]|uniref:uncharacterized protein LOC132054794 n=1 Tax=Lycium ferocissimum TaxID=112874 RepID=UPI0028168192|nr:uncharacterized protein LOC132054794 [Lycium ferocissimum]